MDLRDFFLTFNVMAMPVLYHSKEFWHAVSLQLKQSTEVINVIFSRDLKFGFLGVCHQPFEKNSE